MFYSLFLYGIIDWILEKIPVRNGGGGGGVVRWARVPTQTVVVANAHPRTMGGQTFAILVRMY